MKKGGICVYYEDNQKKRTASLKGLIAISLIGFLLFIGLNRFQNTNTILPDYGTIVDNIKLNKLSYKILWGLKDFSEAPFFGGIISGIGMILGAILAWRLDVKDSKYAGIRISYGLNIWPWIFASQILSMFISIFIWDYLGVFNRDGFTWVATFLLLVGAPPATMVKYGPNPRALITGSVLGSLLMVPVANWLSVKVLIPIGMPGNVANYFALAIGITLTLEVCNALPWIERRPFNILREEAELTEEDKLKILDDPKWLIRRTLADFTEPLFYGNEIVALFAIVGGIIEWLLNINHGVIGTKLFPGILFAQLLTGGISVYLYGRNYLDLGWYPTYISVVSIAPFSVITFGAKLPVILFSAILGGIIGPPFAALLGRRLPEHLHAVIPNVLAMGITTMLVISIMNALPWF